jgi:hypothetical protein
MGRKAATSRGFSRSGERPSGTHKAAHPQWSPRVKRGAVAAAVLALLAIVAVAVVREASTTARGLTTPQARPAATPSRPAFTPAEEAYIQALWPIHGDVERSTVRLSLGQIFYKINDMDRTKLKARAAEALVRSGATPTGRSSCRSIRLGVNWCSAAIRTRPGKASGTGSPRTSSRLTRSSGSWLTRSATC